MKKCQKRIFARVNNYMKNKRMKYIENTKQSESGKYNHDGDCQTYSLAYLLDKDYDEVYKELEKQPFGITSVWSTWNVLRNNNFKAIIDSRDFKDEFSKFNTVSQLARLLKDTNTKVAVNVKDHITVIDNGNIVDKWDCSRRYVEKIHLTVEDYKRIEYMLKYKW